MINNKVEEIKAHVKAISDILGIKETPSNENTPLRIAKMFVEEIFCNRNDSNLEDLNTRMKVFPLESSGSKPITVSDIPFYSMCEHHWLPFFGTVTVSYIPRKSIIGLSKIPRVVKYFSRRPQLQERLTDDIGNYLFTLLDSKYIKVTVIAEHLCMKMRGVENAGNTITIFEK